MQKRSPSSRRRNVRRKSGSIMIMVVALLVLMALIGTAYIATARIDRGSAVQNADNVQIELLVQSVLNMCKTSVSGDAFDGNNNYRGYPRDPFETNPTYSTLPNGYLPDTFFYYNITSPLDDQKLKDAAGNTVEQKMDYWLADRTPSFGGTNANSTNHYYWNRISLPLTTESSANGPVRSFFEDPTYVPAPGQMVYQFSNHDRLEPTFVPINGVPMPAFKVNTGIPGYNEVLAGDADGDGIADSFLSRLPIGTVNGLTYYYAVRIIDNNAAINLNTAWGDKVQMATGPDDEGKRLFPSSIQLDNFNGGPNLFSTNEVNSIHSYRTHSNSGTAKPPLLGTQPWDDFGVKRNDFVFANQHDAFWMQLGRRPENPGFAPPASNPWRFRSFPLSDSISLVPHFILQPATPSSVIETNLTRDLNSTTHSLNGPTQPYAPGNAPLWGNDNFDYSGNNYNRRPLVVMSNAVSTATSPHYMLFDYTIDPPPTPPLRFRDLNEDGIKGNDVPTKDMLVYSVSEAGDRTTLPKFGYMVHLEKYDLTQTPWVTGNSAHFPGDYIQVTVPGVPAGAPPAVLNFVYALSLQKATPSPVDASTTNPGSNYWEQIPNLPTGTPMKTSLNTAGFRELYRSYWNVMCNDKDAAMTPYGTPGVAEVGTAPNPFDINNQPARQFRSSIRDNRTSFDNLYRGVRFPPYQQLLLRSAIAAVNTIDLRDADDDVTSRTIVLQMIEKNSPYDPKPVEVTIYGYEPQPFITEVVANANTITDATGTTTGQLNPKGYVAIELFNPHDRAINLTGWKLGLIDRRRDRGGTEEQMQIIDLNVTFGQNDTVGAGGYFVMENYRLPSNEPPGTPAADTNWTAVYRPSGITTVTGSRKYVPELGKVFYDQISTIKGNGGELVLLRPRRADKQKKSSNRPYDRYDENNIWDWVPVDSFDFTGLKILHTTPPAGGKPVQVHAWHYARESGSGDRRWKCVNAGHYFGDMDNKQTPDPEKPRPDADDVTFDVPPADGVLKDTFTHTPTLGSADSDSSFLRKTAYNQFPPIQLNNRDFGGPTGGPTGPQPRDFKQTGNAFPFGGFMRVGDVMQVPFIGAFRVRELQGTFGNPAVEPATGWYKLLRGPSTFLELNPISIDASFADDHDDANNAVENVGRFCPLPGTGASSRYYDFARRIFDHFTVIAPNEDYLPNINPDRTPDPNKNNTSVYRFGTFTNIMGASGGYPRPHADQVKQIDSGSGGGATEEITGVPGQINLNTANAKVISAIPFTDNTTTNAAIAQAIVDYRDGNPTVLKPVHNPIRSLFDLYNIPGFVSNQTLSGDPDDNEGDFSPTGTGTDGVVNNDEFEKQFLLINRISNLVTTRSDSFTAYVLVQGWRNANTPQAELVVQRRAAMLIDRSGVTPKNREPRSMLIPVE